MEGILSSIFRTNFYILITTTILACEDNNNTCLCHFQSLDFSFLYQITEHLSHIFSSSCNLGSNLQWRHYSCGIPLVTSASQFLVLFDPTLVYFYSLSFVQDQRHLLSSGSVLLTISGVSKSVIFPHLPHISCCLMLQSLTITEACLAYSLDEITLSTLL